MSKASDRHEHLIANSLNEIKGVTAKRPVCSTDYSDILVNYNNKASWLEIKMSHTDNLANPRVYYHENIWKSRSYTPVASYIVQDLNKSQISRDFVLNLSEFSNIPLADMYIATTKGELELANVVSRETMKKFCTINSKYILRDEERDISHIVTTHYTQGKAEPAYYLQAGDDFYMISNTNPLGLPSDIPCIQGTGKCQVRVSNRSKFYEVQAEIKMKNIVSSSYSLLPGSNKRNPFM